jgi:c(7)-type cytochrome triheme protein
MNMHKNDRLIKFLCAVALALLLTPSHWAVADEDTNIIIENARTHAEEAKADAEKALIEAEKAISEADAAIAKANEAKQAATAQKKNALEKMVEAQYYPADIDMTMKTATGQTTAVFSHKKHTQREKLHCMECHPRVFKMKVGDSIVKGSNLSMKEMQKGRFCGNCHDGKKAFDVSSIDNCKRCHPSSRQ